MSDRLALLEQKLEQVLAHCEGLRAENRALRSRVAKLEDERQVLQTKMESARHRLEALLAKIPADAESAAAD